jgi:hypothetical protein
MTNEPASCDLCGALLDYQANRYDGREVPRYRITVCHVCYSSSRNGWSSINEAKILVHLKSCGLPVPLRNARGWLPRD